MLCDLQSLLSSHFLHCLLFLWGPLKILVIDVVLIRVDISSSKESQACSGTEEKGLLARQS